VLRWIGRGIYFDRSTRCSHLFVNPKDAPEEWCAVAAADFHAESEFWEVRGTLSATSRSDRCWCLVAEDTRRTSTAW
jgi:hypothetical protein